MLPSRNCCVFGEKAACRAHQRTPQGSVMGLCCACLCVVVCIDMYDVVVIVVVVYDCFRKHSVIVDKLHRREFISIAASINSKKLVPHQITNITGFY